MMNTKVRLVRCPRCQKVLPEMAEVPVYKCGGCGAILQAKKRRNETRETGSQLHEAGHTPKNELDRVSEEKEASRSNGQTTLPSTGEYSPDETSETNQYKFEDFKREQPGVRNFSNELSSSSELICKNKELLREDGVHMDMDEDKCPLDQFNSIDQNKSGDCNGERPGGRSSPYLVPGSTELKYFENGESSPESIAHTELDEDECGLDQCSRMHQNEGDCIGERTGGIQFYSEVPSSTELNHQELSSTGVGVQAEVDESKYFLDHNNGHHLNKCKHCNGEEPGNMNGSKELSSSSEIVCSSSSEILCNKTEGQSRGADMAVDGAGVEVEVCSSAEFTCHEIEEQSVADMAVGGTEVEMDEDFKSRFIFRSSSAENFLSARSRYSISTAQRALDASISSDDLTSPPKKDLELSQESTLQGFNRVSSVDTLEGLPLVNPISEVSAKLIDMYRSPTCRSYYAYDGSVSSFDGTDDQVPDRHLYISKRNPKEADFVSTNGLLRRNEYRVNDAMDSELEVQHASSITSGKKHHAMKGTQWRQDELPLPTGQSQPFRGRRRLETDEHLSSMPFYSTGSPSGHGSGSPLWHGHKEFQNHSNYHSPDKPGYPEPDKMELLRMVYELKDQLDKTNVTKTKAYRRFPDEINRMEKQIPSYYNHLASEGGIYHELNYPGYPGRYMQGKNLAERCQISRMAFLGEATHQIDCSCLHCCPQDWHSVPPHAICCQKEHTSHLSHNCYNPYYSHPSSPLHYIGSEFSLSSHDIMSDNQQHIDREVKMLYQREKHHSMKRHFRPIAGGAPVIACYHCLELLQLPADYLISRRRCHRLRCNACSEVLIFSLENRTHLVPYNPGAIAPPPSEIDDYSDAINKRNVASASGANGRPHAEPVSCSDDFGQSFCKSCSTEEDPSSLLSPFHALERNSNDKNMSSGISFDPKEDRKKKSAPSSMSSRGKSSFEIEELQTTGSPLHQLMGYSSLSQVIER
ncbi:unnamed protein product [Ilex paraguariensis]|uniref:Zinc-ribbon domain-containing protein n=1 Tax=Ilex paraguariensis TaxID=185542 RepID=A0ABC8QVF3_9AQUA